RRELGDLRVPQLRGPALEVPAERAFELLRAVRGELLVEEVLDVPPRDVVRPVHLGPPALWAPGSSCRGPRSRGRRLLAAVQVRRSRRRGLSRSGASVAGVLSQVDQPW